MIGSYDWLPADAIAPNAWNPNVMDAETAEKERKSILKFGFVVPIIVRELDGRYEIIDGENRWRIGRELGMDGFPVWNLGEVDDDTAKQLTPILNELHGTPDEDKLGELLKDLLSRQDEQQLREVMPFARDEFDRLIGEMTVDWGALEQPTPDAPVERWVERVYRMPAEAANVVDEAIGKACKEADVSDDWRGLEFIAAEFMGR